MGIVFIGFFGLVNTSVTFALKTDLFFYRRENGGSLGGAEVRD
jgi:hypothetical protein